MRTDVRVKQTLSPLCLSYLEKQFQKLKKKLHFASMNTEKSKNLRFFVQEIVFLQNHGFSQRNPGSQTLTCTKIMLK